VATSLHSEYRNGALLFYQTHRHRIVNAIGENVQFYDLQHHDCQVDATDPLGYTATVVEAGSGTTEWTASNTERGASTITCAANENDGGSYQLLGESVLLNSGNWVYFRLKMSVDDVDQTDFFAGFCITDTAILGGATDRIGFQSVDGDAGVDFLVEKNSTETLTEDVGTLADDTVIDLEFVWDGAAESLYSYVNGSLTSTQTATTNLPDDEELRLSIEFLTGEATANVMTIRTFTFCQVNLEA
jgi:hypothetical protein